MNGYEFTILNDVKTIEQMAVLLVHVPYASAKNFLRTLFHALDASTLCLHLQHKLLSPHHSLSRPPPLLPIRIDPRLQIRRHNHLARVQPRQNLRELPHIPRGAHRSRIPLLERTAQKPDRDVADLVREVQGVGLDGARRDAVQQVDELRGQVLALGPAALDGREVRERGGGAGLGRERVELVEQDAAQPDVGHVEVGADGAVLRGEDFLVSGGGAWGWVDGAQGPLVEFGRDSVEGVFEVLQAALDVSGSFAAVVEVGAGARSASTSRC